MLAQHMMMRVSEPIRNFKCFHRKDLFKNRLENIAEIIPLFIYIILRAAFSYWCIPGKFYKPKNTVFTQSSNEWKFTSSTTILANAYKWFS
ncbi:unnamed protein product [Acanthoscelides obtectus]|uniref:Uncharacterized protein n=1 Tax=Acanthoscelides obtectus TaxID=200917 RepID=A0A9P0NYH9_ACAOB|nr:unnamed protein product [Acanthoscelides obtectus]CAK1663661.1 hypothetical protein AOBTE_LOCUS23781 [Acanthoscelides obtectus]